MSPAWKNFTSRIALSGAGKSPLAYKERIVQNVNSEQEVITL
jgi:hypothetical protein